MLMLVGMLGLNGDFFFFKSVNGVHNCCFKGMNVLYDDAWWNARDKWRFLFFPISEWSA